ncbi:hypothetical protein PYW08_010161 [Mythimna loreyi]|uniref:Uncharacterized protein n=1 Tax=Mythimna loreyi TaxID=667449 RepID=A0ACC2Q5U0_9NEOP|nr:hypothetical protein PYW08_010161 [Mythimna loreyi]
MSILFRITLVTCLSVVVNQNEAARILGVFPFPSISHQVVFRTLMNELVKRGHEVTVITTDAAFPKGETPANLTEIDVGEDSYKIWREDFVVKPKGKKSSMHDDFKIIYNVITKIMDSQLKDEQVQKLINDKNQTFDLIFTEAMMRPALVFTHIYKAPAIMISSYGAFSDNYEVMGVSTHPFLYQRSISRRLYNLTLWEKIVELYDYLTIEWIHRNSYNIENQIIKSHFGPETPTVQELNNNVAMFFLNFHPVFEGNTPVPPSVIHMGGIHQKPRKDLPQDLQSYLDSSQNGVIYVSFGTNVDPALFPPEKIATFVRVLSKLPYDVMWKWNNDILPGRTENIKIYKWLPQSDLLRHPKIKLFINQGGLQSTDEAITAGVPLIGIPMLGDQWYNVEKYVKHNIGLQLDLETLNDEILENAIKKVIGDDSYRQNIIRLGKIMQDQPMTPLERVVWWTEHVLRHGGGKHLRAPAANMPWAEYLELELVFTLLFGFIAIIAVLILAVKTLYDSTIKGRWNQYKNEPSSFHLRLTNEVVERLRRNQVVKMLKFIVFLSFCIVFSAGDRINCTRPNEHYECGSPCQTTCATLGQECPINNVRCNDACYCDEGYARDETGTCIPVSEC